MREHPANFNAFVETSSCFETPIHSMHESCVLLGKYGKYGSDTMLRPVTSKDENDQDYQK